MPEPHRSRSASPPGPSSRLLGRRSFLADLGMGCTGLALGSLLAADSSASDSSASDPATQRGPHFPARVRSVIWLFMAGGVSHLESFDPKPDLNKYAGKSLAETPLKDAFETPFVKENFRPFVAGNTRTFRQKILPLQVGYRKHGQSGIELSDWWPHLGQCVDDIAIVRSMWTTDNDHGAQLQFHTGRHISDGYFPTVGAWVHYGLGTLNDNLPQFVVMGNPIGDCCGGTQVHMANYLGAEHDGVLLSESSPLPFGKPQGQVYRQEQAANLELLRRLNGLTAVEYPDDAALRARIQSYELAFRMQISVPGVFDVRDETAATLAAYGTGYGRQLLAARRFVERGVRFVQVYHGGGGGGGWDAHSDLQKNHSANCAAVDKPIATLLKDLKQRGLLDETLVVWGTEFGRTPGTEGTTGRDHHPFGFSCWMAGGGIRGGMVHGATDELGLLAAEDRHYVTDLHATVLHQLGIDSRRLEIPGRKRLEIEHGRPIQAIIG
ncbi:MAG: DUF1501 domain-containing protein [Pirellulaceae bacterium]|nr:DUF1501 domain-containing protein [Pirellulaceae bacterium]